MENKQDKGFTLVELLIVIVILGILATVTVFAVRGITDRGQENSCAVDVRTLETSIEAFYAQYQQDPATIDELTVGFDPGTGLEEPVLKDPPSNFQFIARSVSGTPALTNANGETAGVTAATAVNANSAGFFAPATSPCNTL